MPELRGPLVQIPCDVWLRALGRHITGFLILSTSLLAPGEIEVVAFCLSPEKGTRARMLGDGLPSPARAVLHVLEYTVATEEANRLESRRR